MKQCALIHSELPVTCVNAKGTLYKEKFAQGEFQNFCALHLEWHLVGRRHLCWWYLIQEPVFRTQDIGKVTPLTEGRVWAQVTNEERA